MLNNNLYETNESGDDNFSEFSAILLKKDRNSESGEYYTPLIHNTKSQGPKSEKLTSNLALEQINNIDFKDMNSSTNPVSLANPLNLIKNKLIANSPFENNRLPIRQVNGTPSFQRIIDSPHIHFSSVLTDDDINDNSIHTFNIIPANIESQYISNENSKYTLPDSYEGISVSFQPYAPPQYNLVGNNEVNFDNIASSHVHNQNYDFQSNNIRQSYIQDNYDDFYDQINGISYIGSQYNNIIEENIANKPHNLNGNGANYYQNAGSSGNDVSFNGDGRNSDLERLTRKIDDLIVSQHLSIEANNSNINALIKSQKELSENLLNSQKQMSEKLLESQKKMSEKLLESQKTLSDNISELVTILKNK